MSNIPFAIDNADHRLANVLNELLSRAVVRRRDSLFLDLGISARTGSPAFRWQL
jgi:hypothetical protein